MTSYWSKVNNSLLNSLFQILTILIHRVAAYAKKHLELGREFREKLPKNAHRALLLAVEAEHFLQELEDHNFDIFDSRFRKKSFVKLPYRILKAAKSDSY